jgi:uncharacterized protein (TIGR03083 family)
MHTEPVMTGQASTNGGALDPPESTSDTLDPVAAFFAALLDAPADAPTACAGWTAHELTAHLAAGAAEEADLIEAHLAGAPPRATRALDDRELPYRAMPDAALRDTLVEQGARLTSLLDQLRGDGERAAVDFTGRSMTGADFAMHSRSECSIHRWDLVGSDATGFALLARPELTRHAVTVLTSMGTLAETPTARARNAGAIPSDRHVSVSVRVRSADADDLLVTAADDAVTISLVPPTDEAPTFEVDAADRLLLLWGRRPAGAIGTMVEGDAAQRSLVRALFDLG